MCLLVGTFKPQYVPPNKPKCPGAHSPKIKGRGKGKGKGRGKGTGRGKKSSS